MPERPIPAPEASAGAAPGGVRPVVVLGDLNVDLTLDLPDRAVPGPNEPSASRGSRVAALQATPQPPWRGFGVPVEFHGAVGDDGFGRWLADDLIASGVGTRGLVVTNEAPTCQVIAMVEPDGERYLVVWPLDGGALTRLASSQVDRGLIAGAAWLHTTGMCLRASPVAEAVLDAMRVAREAGVPVSLDLNLRLELWGLPDHVRVAVDAAVTLADVVLGSGAEELMPLARAWGVAASDPEAAAQAVGAGGATVVARWGRTGRLPVGRTGWSSAHRGFARRCAALSAPATRSTAGSSPRGLPACRWPKPCAGATPLGRSRSPETAARGTSRHLRRSRRCSRAGERGSAV